MYTRTNIDFFKYIYYNSFIEGIKYCNCVLEKTFNIPFYTCKNSNYKNICIQLYERNILLLKSNIKLLDLINMVNISYNKPIIQNIQHYKDILQYTFKIHGLKQNLTLDNIKTRFNDPYKEVEERMFFRFELYKHGWSIYQIEKYIYRYLLKKPFIESYITNKYIHMFNELMMLTNTSQNKQYNVVGRPCLPISLKNHINKKNKQQIKNNMNKKYEEVKLYNTLKNNLLTYEERDFILNLLPLNKDNLILINKIKNLVI
jgi:hypothetical protein